MGQQQSQQAGATTRPRSQQSRQDQQPDQQQTQQQDEEPNESEGEVNGRQGEDDEPQDGDEEQEDLQPTQQPTQQPLNQQPAARQPTLYGVLRMTAGHLLGLPPVRDTIFPELHIHDAEALVRATGMQHNNGTNDPFIVNFSGRCTTVAALLS